MTSTTADNFSASLLDDYFAECAEHLAAARQTLLALEADLSAAQPTAALLEELFRRFHSLKGISSMVGVTAAATLAHEMENYLRALRKTEVALTADGVDHLIAGTTTLEQVIAARRVNEAAPDISNFAAQFAALSLVNKEARPLWRCTFQPTPELAARGVNVSVVRTRLQRLGEILQATPQVSPQGVAFEFLVASAAEAEAFNSEGLVGVRADVAPAANEQHSESKVLLAAPAQVVRVSLSRLDELMRMVGELVINRARLSDQLERAAATLPAEQWRQLQETNLALERNLRDLRAGVTRARLAPVAEIFERMPFVVRDLARETGKQARLELQGQRTEMDKYLVERMMDPLLHLVRNAVSHGLESVDERRAQDKPEVGCLTLRAATVGDTVVLEIEDDGRGLAADQVIARAQAAGLWSPAEKLNHDTLLDVICKPGFTTRDEADRASGRGVGMDVVRKTVNELGGTLALRTEVGRGTCFTIALPLTLAIADALIVNVADQRYAVPQTAVREVFAVETNTIKSIENNELLPYRGGVLPLVRLARLFKLPATQRDTLHVFVVGAGLAAVGIAVDRIAGQREIVVRALSDPLVKAPGITGATELGDGRAVLILDVAALRRAR